MTQKEKRLVSMALTQVRKISKQVEKLVEDEDPYLMEILLPIDQAQAAAREALEALPSI